MKGFNLKLLLVFSALGAAFSLFADQHEKKEMDISDIMKMAHKGKTSLSSRAKKGEASQAELKKLIGMYLALEKLSPPRGESRSWKEKTENLTSAAINVFAKTDGALDTYSNALNCRACHRLHKED